MAESMDGEGEVVKHALEYFHHGLKIHPLRADGTKAPVLNDWPDRNLDEKEIRGFFAGKKRGIGIILGKPSGGLQVIDFDQKAAFFAWLKIIEDERPDHLKKFCIVETPRGFHLFVFVDYPSNDPIPGQKLAMTYDDQGKAVTAIETRGDRQYAVAVGSDPSVHELGKQGLTYKLLSEVKVWETPRISYDEWLWLTDAARSLTEVADHHQERPASGEGPPGERPGDIYNKEGDITPVLLQAGWSRVSQIGEASRWRRPGKDSGVSATLGFCKDLQGNPAFYVFSSNPQTGFPEHDRIYSRFAVLSYLKFSGDFSACAKWLIKSQIHSSDERPEKIDISSSIPWGTERWLAQEYVKVLGGNVVIDCLSSEWLVYKLGVWEPFRKEDLRNRYDEMFIMHVSNLAKNETEAGKKSVLLKLFKNLSRKSYLSVLLDSLVVHMVPRVANPWNRNRFLLNTPTGTIDFEKRLFRAHKREDYLTKSTAAQLPAKFGPLAEALKDIPPPALFLEALALYSPPDAMERNKIAYSDYLRRLAAYCLIGRNPLRIAFFLYGEGANGKSVFVDTISSVLGVGEPSSYAAHLHYSTFFFSQSGKAEGLHTLAETEGRRLIVVNEIPPKTRIDETTLKMVSSDDNHLTVRKLYQQPKSIEFQGKVIMIGNSKPIVSDDSPAYWNRLHLVPFSRQFKREEQDPNIREKLMSEYNQIFAELIRYALLVFDQGIDRPEEVILATEEYELEENKVKRFIKQICLVTGNPMDRVSADELYSVFRSWCEGEGIKRFESKIGFGRAMTRFKSVGIGTLKSSKIFWTGLRLLTRPSAGWKEGDGEEWKQPGQDEF